MGKVMGLQSFFVFYGPSGVVSAASTTGITIQREVRESSDGPHFSHSNISNVHMPLTSSSIGNTSAQSSHPSAHYIPSSLDIIRQLWPASIAKEEKNPILCMFWFYLRNDGNYRTSIGPVLWYPLLEHSTFQTICTTIKIGQSGPRHPA